ncbi:SDR family NAD(P)-dependent oxidoreductase [Bythopirellula polymerisocia]|uniref:3-oxoacyl-[acyl-carrier-protein] reductase FabG n=1 Tax=Bythopirellula polymerisocia TaxID=2528003 RepID=A0A5C6CWX5_9BACT|nr:SDR family NAD(P)-dependent oxidoreductase [Bythopirellula polymerisocia]TWU28067.1 3-oxoacyl-[acyl-carrier-protein] reductase FabG [Bythopirellula polymerisocia]
MARRVLENSRILLTGASRGIGRHLALELARQKSRLLVVARNSLELDKLVSELKSQGAASAEALAGDVTDPAIRKAIVERVRSDWKYLDVLINNAGVSAHGRFAGHEEQVLRQIMEVNFYAPTELTRLALPLLDGGQDSLIVNIGSILGHRGMPHNSEYSASKFALRGWSEALRTELHSRGIEVLVVSPGTTDTEFFDHLLAKSDSLPWGKQKGIPPEAVARQVVRAMQLRRTEIYPNWRGRLLVAVNRWVPKLVDRIMNRFG